MADLATAYVRIVPSLQGAPKAIKNELDGVDTSSSGKKMGNGVVSGIKHGVSVGKVAIGNVISNAVTSGATAAANAIKNVVVKSFDLSAEYEQLAGGARKIFNEMDFTKIYLDAQNAYKDLNMSANQYLESINKVGAAFASTMGDETGYAVARQGMLAIADYATGTGLSVDLLNEKYQLITRSAASYQSICDQFQGILPQTSKDFLAQAQAAGLLSAEYTELTQVPVAEYQQALTGMLSRGVADLGLANNALNESTQTISGSIAMTQALWTNFLAELGNDDADLADITSRLVDSIGITAGLIIPKLTEILSGLAYTLPQLVDELLPVLEEHSTELINALSTIIAELLPVILEAALILFMGILVALVKSIPGLLSAMGELVLKLVEALAMALKPMMNAMEENIVGVLNAIGSFFMGMWNAGAELVMNVVNGIGAAGSWIVTTVMGWIDAAVQSVGNFFNSMYNAGVNIINGLINGISANIQSVIDTILGGIQNAVDTALSYLGIHSPSKLFADIGKNTMLGMAKGIEGASGAVEHSMQSAMSDVYGVADGVASVSLRAEATGVGSMASEVASLREELRQMRLVLAIDGRAFAEATVGEIDRAMGAKARRAAAV